MTKTRNVGFAMTILQRRLTSSLAAITASLTRRHERLKDLLDEVRALAAAKARTAGWSASMKAVAASVAGLGLMVVSIGAVSR